jgi:hypothetical protein
VLTSFPLSQSRINTSRRVVLSLRLLARCYQSILRTVNRIESVALRQKNVWESLFSRWQATRTSVAKVQMSGLNKKRIILIKEDTPLPSTVSMESEAFLPGWRMVKNLDRQALNREVAGANLKFSYLAGEIRATVFWHKDLTALRRAAKCVVARQEEQNFKFNSLEFTKVVSKRFLGIPVMSVTAHSRCIQRGFGLAAPRISD